jgi:hypothetical protein
MRRLRGWILGGASGVVLMTAGSAAHAQSLVNCGLFRNPMDQARCNQQNQAAISAYRRERAATYGYYGAYGVNQALKFGAGKVTRGGGLVYGGGNQVGTRLYNGYTGQPPRVLQPGYQPTYPYPFGPPRSFNYQPPPPPSYQPYGTTTRRVW